MAVDAIDHGFVFVADIIGDILFRDVEVEHNTDDIVAKIMKAEVADAGTMQDVRKCLGQAMKRAGIDMIRGGYSLGVGGFESFANGRHHGNSTITGDAFGALFDDLVIFIYDNGAIHADGAFFEIDVIPSQGADLATAHTAAGGKDNGDIMGSIFCSLDYFFYFFLGWDFDLNFFFFRECCARAELRAEGGKDRGDEGVIITDGFGGMVERFRIDGNLQIVLRDFMQRHGHQRLQRVAANGKVIADGAGGENGRLRFDISIEGVAEGHFPGGTVIGGGVTGEAAIKSPLHDGCVALIGEGLHDALTAGIGTDDDLGAVAAGGQPRDAWWLCFLWLGGAPFVFT